MTNGMTLLSVRSTADLLYNYGLSSAYRSQYVYDPSFATAREPDIWELVQNDAVIKSAMDRSAKAVVRPWRIEAFDGSREKPDQQLAAVIRDALSQIPRFNRRRRRLSEARILGRTYGVILWQRRTMSLGGSDEIDWYVPYEIQDVDRRRFHWVPEWSKDGTTKTGIHLEMYNTNTSRWEILPPELRSSMIEYIYQDTEDRVGNGRGLIEPTYFYHYMKTVTFEKISQGIDRWANGVWIGTVDGLRGASTGKTNEALRVGMMNMMNIMRSQHVGVLENVDDVKVIETSGTGHQISMDFMRYLDESVERLYNGSVRPAGHTVGGTGSKSAGETEQDETESFFQEEREDLDAIVGRDLVGAFLRVNRPQLESQGLSKARRPKFTSEQIKKQDPLKAVQVMGQALQYVPLSRRQFYEKIECEDPGDDGDEQRIEPVGVMGMGGDGASFDDFGVNTGRGKSSKTYSTGNGEKKAARADMEAHFEAQEEKLAQLQAENAAQFSELRSLLSGIANRPAPAQAPTSIHVEAAAPPPPAQITLTTNVEAGEKLQEQMAASFKGLADEVKGLKDAIPVPPAPIINVEAPVPTPIHFNPTIQVPAQAEQKAPQVTVNVPQGPAPVAKFQVNVPAQAPPQITVEDRSAGALARIADAVEGIVGWVKSFFGTKKPAPVAKDITFKTDPNSGRIIGAEVKPKE